MNRLLFHVSQTMIKNPSTLLFILSAIDIETPLLNVGEDFQALVSIAVNPSYFFVQNTLFTHDLEKLAQSMK